MRACPRCAFENDPGSSACAQCRSWLGWPQDAARDGVEVAAAPPDSAAPDSAPPAEIPATPPERVPSPSAEHVDPAPAPSPLRGAATAPSATVGGQVTPTTGEAPPPPARIAPRFIEPGRRRVVRPPGLATPADPANPARRTIPTDPATPANLSSPADAGLQTPPPPRTQPPTPRRPDLVAPQRPGMHGGAGAAAARTVEALHPDDLSRPRPIRPDQESAVTGTPTRSAGSGASGDGAAEQLIQCPYCLRSSAARRHFCRCGRSLPRPATTAGASGPAATRGGRRRRPAGGDGFWSLMRAANNGARASFDRGRAARDQVLQVTAALGVTGILASQVGPWGAEVRGQTWARVQSVLPSRFAVVPDVTATSDTVAEPAIYWTPGHATDRDLLTAWASTWQEEPAGTGDGCGRDDGAATVTLTLTSPTDVARVTLAPGLAQDSPQRNRQFRPRTVAVRIDTTCEEFAVADIPDRQAFDVRGDGATTLQVQIVDVWQPRTPAPGPGLVALSEVLVQTRDQE